MKVFFIISTYATLFLVFYKFKATYDSNNDTFRAELLVIPVAGLAVLVNHEFSVMEVSAGLHLTFQEGKECFSSRIGTGDR